MNGLINIWEVQSHNYVNGPGCRFVIWVQGCPLACPECWNKHTWTSKKRNLVSVERLFDQIAETEGISGVTFSGGEPFAQAKSLSELAQMVKNDLGLNLQIFTGYEIDELKGRHQKALLDLADVIVAGRFDPSVTDNNQKVYQKEDVKWKFNNTNVEVEVDSRGNLIVTGYPSDGLIRQIQEIVR